MLITASRVRDPVPSLTFETRGDFVNDGAVNGQWEYIQGAGDDEEAWSGVLTCYVALICKGLTPSLFWANKDLLLAASWFLLVSFLTTEGMTTLCHLSRKSCQSRRRCRLPSASCLLSESQLDRPADLGKLVTIFRLGQLLTSHGNCLTKGPHMLSCISPCFQLEW